MSGHHTPEQVEKAFAYAPTILRKLAVAGMPLCSFQLYSDASGRLILGWKYGDKPTRKQFKLAEKLVYSNRRICNNDQIGIAFCCGLITAAEEVENES